MAFLRDFWNLTERNLWLKDIKTEIIYNFDRILGFILLIGLIFIIFKATGT